VFPGSRVSRRGRVHAGQLATPDHARLVVERALSGGVAALLAFGLAGAAPGSTPAHQSVLATERLGVAAVA